jgi:hypothetical protein
MFIMAEPRGYQEPPSGPENIRKNFCSACTAGIIKKSVTTITAQVQISFFDIFSSFAKVYGEPARALKAPAVCFP